MTALFFLPFSALILLLLLGRATSRRITNPSLVCNAATKDRTIYQDVVIVGAGVSGIANARHILSWNQNPVTPRNDTISFVVLEAGDYVGGRVRTTNFSGVLVEDGANWLAPSVWSNGNPTPIARLAERIGIAHTLSNFSDFDGPYQSPAAAALPILPIPDWNERLAAIDEAFLGCLAPTGDTFYDPRSPNGPDIGGLAKLKDCGWTPQDNIDEYILWLYMDFDFAAPDSSLRSFGTDETQTDGLDSKDSFVYDQTTGYAGIPIQMADRLHDSIKKDHEVVKIRYGKSYGDGYEAAVYVRKKSNGNCKEYITKRVISTVSIGVLENRPALFAPRLNMTTLPFKMGQYEKLFLQFKNPFWEANGDHEWIGIVRNGNKTNLCSNWQNLNHFVPGSNILICILTTGYLERLLGDKGKFNNREVSKVTMPLKQIFGEAFERPIHWYSPNLKQDKFFGYGAYANWQVGFTFQDFYKFFGGWGHSRSFGGESSVAAGSNGNGWRDGIQIVHLSGAASCNFWWETVNGAILSGRRTFRYLLASLGYADYNDEAYFITRCENF